MVIETLQSEKLSYREAAERFEIPSNERIRQWERIYLEEGPEGIAVERRGRGSKGRPRKLSKETEEDLIAEVQCLRAENAYIKLLQALVLEDEQKQHKSDIVSYQRTPWHGRKFCVNDIRQNQEFHILMCVKGLYPLVHTDPGRAGRYARRRAA